MTGDEELSNEELMPIFEAARWAASAFNTQPWRFIYAKRNTVREEVWNSFFNLLVEGNKEWVKNAAVLTVVISKKRIRV
jgi:nitroreductase